MAVHGPSLSSSAMSGTAITYGANGLRACYALVAKGCMAKRCNPGAGTEVFICAPVLKKGVCWFQVMCARGFELTGQGGSNP
eukprot:2470219-Rhodomonas_salina.1